MVKPINYSLITTLYVATFADPHMCKPLFTRSLMEATRLSVQCQSVTETYI